jgi:hypothetical protein
VDIVNPFHLQAQSSFLNEKISTKLFKFFAFQLCGSFLQDKYNCAYFGLPLSAFLVIVS